MNQPCFHAPCYINGTPVESEQRLPVHDPYSGEIVGSVPRLSLAEVEPAIEACMARQTLTRHQRSEILQLAKTKLIERSDEFADSIRLESGLCRRETEYEVRRAADVLQFAAMEALRDDGEIFSCDVSQNGKARKIFTTREPASVVLAITPFNHPLNQVAHKVAPAIAAGAPMILKPSDKTPLTAIRFAQLLFECGLPGSWLHVVLGDIGEVVEPLIADARIELVTFTGSAAIGKRISAIAGYKRLCLELGGNSPLIVMDDADLDLAEKLACEGCYRNSGQRCTAVKRLLVHRDILDEFTQRVVARTAEYTCGDPADPATRVGTVIDEAAARHLKNVVDLAVAQGARVLAGGEQRGAIMEPTVIDNVPRDAQMIVEESFGPLAPIIAVDHLDDAIEVANSTAYGLSSGIVTASLESATKAVKALRTGTVNVNEVPGYRIECSPFGGIKDSGLGVKEGVIEAMKTMSYVKTFSLPW